MTPVSYPEHIILASKSPRRQELLKGMGIDFKVVIRDVDESFPEGLDPVEAVSFIAKKKAEAFEGADEKQLIITADTVVVLDGQIIGKPADDKHAFEILSSLSGKAHQVITAIAILYKGQIDVFHETTQVHVAQLSSAEIEFYIRHYRPYDKAGAYGIQEWIGMVGIEKIAGSYTNVVGLPTARLYRELQKIKGK